MVTQTFTVDGMACDGCEANVTDELVEIDGVTTVDADHEAGRVAVEMTEDVAPETLASAIESAGYEVID